MTSLRVSDSMVLYQAIITKILPDSKTSYKINKNTVNS